MMFSYCLDDLSIVESGELKPSTTIVVYFLLISTLVLLVIASYI